MITNHLNFQNTKNKMEKPSILCFHGLALVLLAFHFESATVIKYLPGFEGPLPFYFETGYIGVGDAEEVELFYYFVKSETNPEEDPMLLWISGGPGCSALSGLTLENGPFTFKELEYNGSLPTLLLKPNSWTKISSVIYIDLPVGTGFSYATNCSSPRSSDRLQVSHADEFLRKWLRGHTEFLTNPLYISGDSYSGITIPAIVQRLSIGNEKGIEPMLNLKGYIIGNPTTDYSLHINSQIPVAHGMALISDELYQGLQKSCKEEYSKVDPTNLECKNNLKTYRQCLSGINKGSILEPITCGVASPNPLMEEEEIAEFDQGRRMLLHDHYDDDDDGDDGDSQLSLPTDPSNPDCKSRRTLLCRYWANDDTVRKALHIRQGTIGEWLRCNFGLDYEHDITSSFEYHLHLSTKGYRSLIYNGDHDLLVPFLGTQAWIRALNYSIVEDWRSWRVQGQVAGYTRTYSNGMTYATVKGGEHVALENKAAECFAMFQRWIQHEPL